MERLAATLEYVSTSTGFLPALFAFSLAPAASLRTWLAVQALDDPVKVDDAMLKREKRKMMLRALAFLAIFFTVEILVLSRGSEDLIDMFFRAIVGSLFQLSCFVFFADLLKTGRWVAYRRPSGLTSWRIAPGSISTVKVILATGLASLANAGAYLTDFRTPAVLVSTAVLYRFMGQAQTRSVSLRMTMIALISWLALTAVLSAGLIMALINSDLMNEEPTASSPAASGEVRILIIDEGAQPSTMSAEVERYIGLIMPFAFSAGPGFLLAIAYRFDFAQHLALTGNSSPTLDTLDAPIKKPHFTRGVLVPAVTPRGHSKPYFASALGGWLVAQALVAALFTFLDIPLPILETQRYDLLVLTLAIPLMCAGVVSMAVCRGEFRAMWRYTEKWSPSKEDMKAVTNEEEVEEDAEGAQDEILAYSDEKEAVPEYTPFPGDVKA